jgi:hypothetical protein
MEAVNSTTPEEINAMRIIAREACRRQGIRMVKPIQE